MIGEGVPRSRPRRRMLLEKARMKAGFSKGPSDSPGEDVKKPIKERDKSVTQLRSFLQCFYRLAKRL